MIRIIQLFVCLMVEKCLTEPLDISRKSLNKHKIYNHVILNCVLWCK